MAPEIHRFENQACWLKLWVVVVGAKIAYCARVWICPECRTIHREHAEVCHRDGVPLAEVQAHQSDHRYPLLGKVVDDRYQLIGGLGQGGLGTVYLSLHRHLDQLYAVKFLELDALVADSGDAARRAFLDDFQAEAKVASLLRHKAVVQVIDFGIFEDRLPYLVMEYIPGPSLLHVLASEGRMAVDLAADVARQIAEALETFHDRRLAHRDLKPANVVLDPRRDGRLTLVDLGLVKDLSEGGGQRNTTHPAVLRGTPGYIAPEQVPDWVLLTAGLTSEKHPVDERIDLYALGVIFYEMLAGVSPYPAGGNTEILIYACTQDPIPLGRVEPPLRLPAGLATLVLDTMARDPARRPRSARVFIERLDAVMAGDAADYVPESSGLFLPSETPPGGLSGVDPFLTLEHEVDDFPEARPRPSSTPAFAAARPFDDVEALPQLRIPGAEEGGRPARRWWPVLVMAMVAMGAMWWMQGLEPTSPSKRASSDAKTPLVVDATVATPITDSAKPPKVVDAVAAVAQPATKPVAAKPVVAKPVVAKPQRRRRRPQRKAAPRKAPAKVTPTVFAAASDGAQLLSEAKRAYEARDIRTALKLYKRFQAKASRSHPRYSTVRDRIRALEDILRARFDD